MLLKIDMFIHSRIVCPIIDKLSDKTGYTNFWFARVSAGIGTLIIEIMYLISMALSKGNPYFMELLAFIWALICYQRFTIISKAEKAYERCKDSDTIDLELVKLCQEELFTRIFWGFICVFGLLFSLMALAIPWFDIGLAFITFSIYATYALNDGGKKLTEKVKEKAKALWAKAKELIPSPIPAPAPVLVRVYNYGQYVRNLSSSNHISQRRNMGA